MIYSLKYDIITVTVGAIMTESKLADLSMDFAASPYGRDELRNIRAVRVCEPQSHGSFEFQSKIVKRSIDRVGSARWFESVPTQK